MMIMSGPHKQQIVSIDVGIRAQDRLTHPGEMGYLATLPSSKTTVQRQSDPPERHISDHDCRAMFYKLSDSGSGIPKIMQESVKIGCYVRLCYPLV